MNVGEFVTSFFFTPLGVVFLVMGVCFTRLDFDGVRQCVDEYATKHRSRIQFYKN